MRAGQSIRCSGAPVDVAPFGLAEFKADEAIALRIVLGISTSPLFATAVVAVLAVIAVAVTYVMLRSRFGGTAALIAVGLFATAPWAVLHGRHLWQHALAAALRARDLNADDPATECLLWGKLAPPEGVTLVKTRNRLRDASPLPCAGRPRAFGPLDACFPR